MREIEPFVLQLFSLAANIATVIGIGIAIWAGYKTYTSWKTQLIGTAKYELARKILKAVYELREAVRGLRTPIKPRWDIVDEMRKEYGLPNSDWFSSVPPPELELEYLNEEMQKVGDALAETQIMELEAEVLLHPEVKQDLVDIRQFVVHLHFRYSEYTRLLLEIVDVPPEEILKELRKEIRDEYDKLFRSPIDDGPELRILIEQLEGELKRYFPQE